MAAHRVVTRRVPTFYFIGVTTGQSSIMRVFPLWTRELGRPEVVIEGVDCRIHDDPERYRQAVAQIKYDPLSLGALVTTHKIDLLEAARDMFDYLDPYAQVCGEVSCISKRNGALEGHAKDPISAGLSLDAVLGEDAGEYTRFARTGRMQGMYSSQGTYSSQGMYSSPTSGEVLCFGAGGSAAAIALHLIYKRSPGDCPGRFVVVNRSPGRLDRLQRMVEGLETDIAFQYICNQDPRRNDEIMAGMPARSVVINATGMGKDTPGSPITGAGLFPMDGVAWELNYRGALDFMHQALAQQASRRLTVEDGWRYFLHGWTQVIAQVYHVTIGLQLFERLEDIAAEAGKPR